MLLVFSAIVINAQDKDQQRWIQRLKETPVSQLDPALDNKTFSNWFNELTKSAPAKYEVNDCGERGYSPEEKGREFPFCVEVSADAGVRRITLSFVVGTYIVAQSANEKAKEKPAKVAYFGGSIGPANPAMKFPSAPVRKLSDLKKLLSGGS